MPERLDDQNLEFANKLKGVRVWLHVLGCRSNLYESEAIAGELQARGAEVRDRCEGASVAVIVTCSVTAAADKKCRQVIRRARREVGNGVVLVCGCWAQGVSSSEARELGIDILVGNRVKSRLADALEARIATGERPGDNFTDIRLDLDNYAGWDALSLLRPVLRTRSFLKVQEGCSHFCSYCVIPILRGRPVSRPLNQTLDEIRRMVDVGSPEIVLTGIHLGSYGHDLHGSSCSLAELVREVSKIEGLKRFRLGSLEPFTLDEPLLVALAESPVFCPHLHLPMQSGDDEVLERMRRGHKAMDFLNICERARKLLGRDLHVSSDVLIGFPGESECAFKNTLAVMEQAGLGRIHIFPYSPRKGTMAAEYPNRVQPEVLAERVRRATALGDVLLQRYASRFVGRVMPVLMEAYEDGCFRGYTRNFVEMSYRGSAAEEGIRKEMNVMAHSCIKGKLEG